MINPSHMNAKQLEDLLKQEIPISQSLGIQILNISDRFCELRAPLLSNVNHKGTAFGGSLYSVCALASYGLFLFGLREQNIQTNNIVISKGEIKYLLPVTSDFQVRAEWPSGDERTAFFQNLTSRGKARVVLHSKIWQGSNLACEFIGHFVAFK